MKSVPALQIKAAVVQGQTIKPAEVTDLANLPGKPELYARLLSVLQAPGDQPRARAERRAARPDERARAGGTEAQGIVGTEPTLSNGLFKEQSAMAEVNQQQVIDYIKGISVMELSQLVKALETELGVTAAAAMPMMGMPMMAAAARRRRRPRRRPSSP